MFINKLYKIAYSIGVFNTKTTDNIITLKYMDYYSNWSINSGDSNC